MRKTTLLTVSGSPGWYSIRIDHLEGKPWRIVSWELLRDACGNLITFDTEAEAIAHIQKIEGGQ